MEAPDFNNVYSAIRCEGRLEELASLLKRAFAPGEAYVSIKTSGFDGAKTLFFSGDGFEFDAYSLDKDGDYLFNGGVAGDDEEVLAFVRKLNDVLHGSGFHPRFDLLEE